MWIKSTNGRVFSGFPSLENKLFGAEWLLLSLCCPVCWPCRVQLIDKGFCPCHQGLMSFCQLPGSPVPHPPLLFFSSSIPDRSLSASLLFSHPFPAPNHIHSTFPGDIQSYRGASRHSLQVTVSIRVPSLKAHHQRLTKLWEGARHVNPISFLSEAHRALLEHPIRGNVLFLHAPMCSLAFFKCTCMQPFYYFTTHLHNIAVTASPVAQHLLCSLALCSSISTALIY